MDMQASVDRTKLNVPGEKCSNLDSKMAKIRLFQGDVQKEKLIEAVTLNKHQM